MSPETPVTLKWRGFLVWGDKKMSALVSKRTVLLLDGGHLRARAHVSGYEYSADFIEACAHGFIRRDDALVRVLYYDCCPFAGTKKKPISEEPFVFEESSEWLNDLASREKFAVRLGILKWRGWKPKRTLRPDREPTDDDFVADLEQKGVDLRIGLDFKLTHYREDALFGLLPQRRRRRGSY